MTSNEQERYCDASSGKKPRQGRGEVGARKGDKSWASLADGSGGVNCTKKYKSAAMHERQHSARDKSHRGKLRHGAPRAARVLLTGRRATAGHGIDRAAGGQWQQSVYGRDDLQGSGTFYWAVSLTRAATQSAVGGHRRDMG